MADYLADSTATHVPISIRTRTARRHHGDSGHTWLFVNPTAIRDMVDFQSRDTGRDRSIDEEEDSDETETQTSDTGTGSDTTEAETESAEGETDAALDAPESEPPARESGSLADAAPDDTQTGHENAAPTSDYVEIREDQGRGTSEEHGVERSHEHGHDSHDRSHDSHERTHSSRDHGPVAETLGVALITVSSTRTMEDDPSGDAIRERIEADDHEIVERDLVADDLDGVQRAVLAVTDREDVDVVVTTGGTGVTPDDVTIEAVQPLFDKKLPGFGELFRILSYEQVGTRALGTRATAGISEGVPVFCLPGSENAVQLGTEELILPEMGHLVGLAQRDD